LRCCLRRGYRACTPISAPLIARMGLPLERTGAEGYLIRSVSSEGWRDASIAYFQTVSRRPLPAGYDPPEHDLRYYEALCFPYAPGSASPPWAKCN
jgi:alpha-glucuronidase